MRRLLLTFTALLVCAPPAHASWSWPVQGEVITQYRNGADPYAGGQHRGIDIAAAVDTPVVAAAGGEVRFAGTAGSSGLTVSVRTADGFDTSYLHLSSFAVRAGARVAAGERLGAVGTTGTRSAVQPHLHFGVREVGTRHAYVDPLSMLPPAAAPPPSEAPRPVPAPAPLSPRPGPVPEPAPRGAPRRAPAPRFEPRRAPAPRPAPAPRFAPRPVPAPRLAPRPVAEPRLAPRLVPEPRLAPRLVPAPSTRHAPSRRVLPRPAAAHGEAPAPVPARTARPALMARPAPAIESSPPPPPPSSSGPDLAWALACAGLLLGAGVLGLTEHGRKATARGRTRVAGTLRPLLGRR